MACIDDVTQLIGELQAGELCLIDYWCAAGAPPDWIYDDLIRARKIAKFLSAAKKLLPLTKDELNLVLNGIHNESSNNFLMDLIRKKRLDQKSGKTSKHGR